MLLLSDMFTKITKLFISVSIVKLTILLKFIQII